MEDKPKIWITLMSVILAIALLGTSIFFVTDQRIFKQSKVDENTNQKAHSDMKWRLDGLYNNDQAWKSDFESLKRDLARFASYKGKMASSPAFLKAALDANRALDTRYDRLYAYALLKRDGDFANESAENMWTGISGYRTEKNEKTAFFYPELYRISKKKLHVLAQNPLLAGYRERLTSIAEDNYEPDDRAEYIKAISGNVLGAPEKFYQAYMYEYDDENSADDNTSNGDRTSSNRNTRKRVFDQANRKIERGMPLLSAAMASKVETNRFQAKSEGYQDVVEAFINDDGLDLESYGILMDEAKKDRDLLQRYMSYKKKALKLSGPLKYYDADIKTTEGYGPVAYEKAVDLTREVVKGFGKSYSDVFDKAIKEQWVDVYPRENKYTGSYTYSAYTGHPYLLLNYDDNLDSAATLAHESGHAVNQYLTNKARRYEDADIPMVNAEIASTVNEILFYDTVLKKAKNDQERAAVLEATIENMNNGFFYQAALAEFQERIHRDSEAGLTLDSTYFKTTFGKILGQYYGPDYEVSEYDKTGWAHVDHLYWDFYVYKYVMCTAIAVDLANRLEGGDAKLLQSYETFLQVGSTKSVEENLSSLGIDLNDPSYMSGFRTKYNALLEELMKLEKR